MKLTSLLAPVVFAAGCLAQPEVIIAGLQGPQKLALTAAGNYVVTETSANTNSGRVSLITRGGVRRSLIGGLPSGTEVAGGGSGPTALLIRDRTLFLALGSGDTERRGTVPGTSIHNPEGASSPLFSSILVWRFGRDIDALTGTFQLTPEQRDALNDGAEIEIADGAGGGAQVRVLARFPVSEPAPNVVYRFSNLWGMALTTDGQTLYVNDASGNSVNRVDVATGRWQRILRFPPSRNPTTVGPPVIDAVPTSVRLFEDHLLVSFLTGFPFISEAARVIAVNTRDLTEQPFINLLTSATDILPVTTSTGRWRFYVIEFSRNQSATPPAPGRLLRYDTPEASVLASDLIGPVSLAYDAATSELIVLEITGRLLRFKGQ